MKLSYDWLQDFARFDSIPFARIIEKIALSICEVDEIEEYKEFLQDVRIVSVEKIEKHPQADKLSICQVSDGTNTHTVVTAATNIQQSNHVPLAIPGASIAGKQIQKASLRGVESFGMFVSGKEIEINEDNSGVWILPEDSPLGTSIREYYSCNDKIFHIDNKSITHRPDLWSHFGFARELAAQLSLPIDFDPFQARFAFSKGKTIAVKQNNNAHSYYACLLENIQVQPSQEKISKRLEKCGINTINNVVDISNYVMLEMGQPTHFFDKQTLASVELEVSLSQKGEAFLLLDDSKPELVEGLPLIRNQNVPVAVAGVMGSKESSVQDTSKELILESAVFKRETIRKSIRATGIRSEASMRYEKGLDSSLSLPVLNRTLFLLQENGCPELICYFPAGFNNQSAKTIKIITSVAFINRKLGKALEAKEIVSILKRLHFMVKRKEDTLEIIVPKFRHNYDVTIPEDIVEEVGRSLEYSTIQPFPLSLEVKPPAREYKRELERKLKFSFSAKAFTEVFTYSFCSAKENQFEDKDAQGLALQNPMPEEFQELKLSPYPSLIKSIISNQDRFEQIRVFEYARTYHRQKDELAAEKRWFCFAQLKNYKKNTPLESFTQDFLNLRDDVLQILLELNLPEISLERTQISYLHPNASLVAKWEGKTLFELGYLHPAQQDSLGLNQRLLLGKIDFSILLELYQKHIQSNRFHAPSVFPEDKIDISLVLDEKEPSEAYANIISQAQIPEAQKVWVHDIYSGENLPEGKKSVTYRVQLVTYDKTFSGKRIQEITQTLVHLAKDNNLQMRE